MRYFCMAFVMGIYSALPGMSLYAAETTYKCGRGYYLQSNGQCGLCDSSVGAYYCTGNDALTPCPEDPMSSADYQAKAGHPVYKYGTISVWDSISADGLIDSPTDCHHYVQFKTDGGVYVMQGIWNGSDYWNDVFYWNRVDAGYYLCKFDSINAGSQQAVYRDTCKCTNAPANARYTDAGTPDDPVRSGGRTDYNDCPWECDTGYGAHDGGCAALCTSGFTVLKTSTGVNVNVWAAKYSTPAINISTSRGTCYVTLAPGTAGGALNIQYGGNTYHTVD